MDPKPGSSRMRSRHNVVGVVVQDELGDVELLVLQPSRKAGVVCAAGHLRGIE